MPKYEQKPKRYNSLSKKSEELTFKISNSVDTDLPTLTITPTEQKKSLVYYGCGPASWVYFNLAAQDKSEIFVRASVKNKATGQTTIYILNLENGVIKIGHGMCSGAFHFDNSNNFEVVFQLFDQSGNRSSLTKAISFNKPNVTTNDE